MRLTQPEVATNPTLSESLKSFQEATNECLGNMLEIDKNPGQAKADFYKTLSNEDFAPEIIDQLQQRTGFEREKVFHILVIQSELNKAKANGADLPSAIDQLTTKVKEMGKLRNPDPARETSAKRKRDGDTETPEPKHPRLDENPDEIIKHNDVEMNENIG